MSKADDLKLAALVRLMEKFEFTIRLNWDGRMRLWRVISNYRLKAKKKWIFEYGDKPEVALARGLAHLFTKPAPKKRRRPR